MIKISVFISSLMVMFTECEHFKAFYLVHKNIFIFIYLYKDVYSIILLPRYVFLIDLKS
jgi:hypothetical protein